MIGSECALKPAPFPPLSSVPGGVLMLGGKKRVPSVNINNLVSVILSPDDVFVSGRKRINEVDINHFNMFHAHANLGIFKLSQQHGIRLVGELAPCSRFSQKNRVRVATPYHTATRTQAPMELINVDTTKPYPEALGGSWNNHVHGSASHL